MGHRSSRKYVVRLQPVNGGSRALTFEITGNKADKVLALLMPEIEKKEKSIKASSITLERFFIEDETNE